MYRSDGKLIVSASDLLGWLDCQHLTRLDLEAASTGRPRPRQARDALDHLGRRGLEHERAWLQQRRAAGLRVEEIRTTSSVIEALRQAEAATLEALRGGADVVYQASFLDARGEPLWRGHADFLQRVELPSALGSWSYEPYETKLARRVHVDAVLQLCHYAAEVGRLCGTEPTSVHIVLGGKESVRLRLADYAAYYRTARARFLRGLSEPEGETYPHPVTRCPRCDWDESCRAQRAADDHLSFVAGIRRDHIEKLAQAGIRTLAGLAGSSEGARIPGIQGPTFARLQRQARLQSCRRRDPPEASPPWELLENGLGLGLLPTPSPGDLFFDMEGDPLVDGGLEYLFGVGWIENGAFSYRDFWAHDSSGEKRAFEAFVDFVIARLERWPELHVYHYGDYERATLGRLMGRHATREREIDKLLRGDVLVDLFAIVRRSIQVGTNSYSLKDLESLWRPRRSGSIRDAGASIAGYERWIEEQDAQILDELRSYNREDCESTWSLRAWLEERREEAERSCGAPLARREPQPQEGSPELEQAEDEVAALVSRLIEGVPDDPGRRTPAEHARWILAQLLGWHRREEKPEWWAYFRRSEMSEDELFEDSEAIVGLAYSGVVGQEKRSLLHRYCFDPAQEHKLVPGEEPHDPATGRAAGEVVAIDSNLGTIDLKRAHSSKVPHPRSLIPAGPISTTVLRRAVARAAQDVAERGIGVDAVASSVRDLLLRRRPRLSMDSGDGSLRRDGEPELDACVRLACALEQSYLPIQGPPGAGKTYCGARIVLSLVRLGRRVGITAYSHAAIGELLEKVMRAAQSEGVPIRALQRAPPEKRCVEPGVAHAKDNPAIDTALSTDAVDVVAGTPWLFAREELAGKLDTLVIDEAGQLSLANAVAVGGSAQNLILLGDPQQLAQPSKGSHPPGAELSALEHVLDGAATMPPERGVFLDHSRRMHPSVCAFVSEISYEGKLESAPECARQVVLGEGIFSGSGLRWVPVEHSGNRTSCEEEARVVRDTVQELLGKRWIDRAGDEHEIGPADILVVAPYNAQVACIAQHLRTSPTLANVPVGTVDRFQGREAAVVVLSMAASGAEDVPRGLAFLYSRNRLNVAVSRARAVAVVIASPELLHARCRTPEELRLVNALCRFAEPSHG